MIVTAVFVVGALVLLTAIKNAPSRHPNSVRYHNAKGRHFE